MSALLDADSGVNPEHPDLDTVAQVGPRTAMLCTIDGAEWIESDVLLSLEDMR